MTTLRNDAKYAIIQILRDEGYATYAKLTEYFDIYLTDDPNVVGYMLPGKAKIVLNKNLNTDQVSFVVRHEILHEYLAHGVRYKEYFEKNPKFARLGAQLGTISNIAADFEISNVGYTEKDKRVAKNIKLNNQIIQGLVTDIDEPEWVDLSYEEILTEMLKKYEDDLEALEKLIDMISKIDKMTAEDKEEQDKQQSGSKGKSTGSKGSKGDSADGEEDSESGSGEEEAEGDGEEKEGKGKSKGKAGEEQDGDGTGGEGENTDEIFKSPEEQRDLIDVATRVEKIRNMLRDERAKQDVFDNTARAKQRDRAARVARQARLSNRGYGAIRNFRVNLDSFIKDQIRAEEEESYARIHPSYEDSEFIVPWRYRQENFSKPLINVYWDVSGSFDDPAKTAAAAQAIGTLQRYEKDDKIEVKAYYFADKVSETKSNAGWGTNGTPILDHIEMTKPNNVIIITDGDINDCTRRVQVKGAVWFLFYDSVSDNLTQHLRGRKQTKQYLIKYR